MTTDFGLEDWFVGTMKGIVLDRAPQATIVDLCHGAPRGDIRAGAFALAMGCGYFPAGAVHLAVVDPGVGSERAAIAASSGRYYFVAPDNGLLCLALQREEGVVVRRIENEALRLPEVSRTFHGRDLFAPAAASLANGFPFEEVGPAFDDWIRLPMATPEREGERWRGEVAYVDRYGNAITNLPNALAVGAREVVAREGAPVRDCYAAVSTGEPVAVAGSTGFIEIALNGGRAAERYGLRPGSPVSLG